MRVDETQSVESKCAGEVGLSRDGSRLKVGRRATVAVGRRARQRRAVAREDSSKRMGMMAVSGWRVEKEWARLPVQELTESHKDW